MNSNEDYRADQNCNNTIKTQHNFQEKHLKFKKNLILKLHLIYYNVYAAMGILLLMYAQLHMANEIVVYSYIF